MFRPVFFGTGLNFFFIYSLQKKNVEKIRQLYFYFQLILKLKSNPSKFIKKQD